MKKIFLFLFTIVVFAACERKIDEFAPNANGVDFSKFVAVGNSLTAGYSDGALYTSGQVNSIPNIMAGQFKTAGGGTFTQPMIGTEQGVGVSMTPAGPYFTTKMTLQVLPVKNCDGSNSGTYSMKPALADPTADQATLAGQLMAPPTEAGPYNNMGVPGATLQSLFFPGYGSQFGNPYFARFATDPMATIIHDAVVQQPTFFNLWIGDNDVLSSALAGTDMLITPVDTFAKYFNFAVGALMNSGKSPKGVLCNIPNITTIPFFTTIPYNGLVLPRQSLVDSVNMAMRLYQLPFTYTLGQNPFLVADPSSPHPLFKVRQMQPGELVLLTVPQDSMKCYGMGLISRLTFAPWGIPSQYVLTLDEVNNISTAVTAYNQIIKGAADANNLAYANMNSYMEGFTSSVTFDGITMSLQYISGGLFSTDGIHLCPRGNAMAANYIIHSINTRYGCNIPEVNIGDYPGLIFP